MKLRLHDASVRLRLSADEADAVGRGESVHCAISLPDASQFRYSVVVTTDGELTVLGGHDGIAVSVPRDQAARWATSADISLAAQFPVDGGVLHLLIEKDLGCSHTTPPAPRHSEEHS